MCLIKSRKKLTVFESSTSSMSHFKYLSQSLKKSQDGHLCLPQGGGGVCVGGGHVGICIPVCLYNHTNISGSSVFTQSPLHL